MIKALKVRLYPTKKQSDVLDLHIDGYRFAYNLCLEYKNHLWSFYKKRLSKYDLQNELFEVAKTVPWLSACKVECIRQAALDVDASFVKFYNGNGWPKFKSKRRSNATFMASQNVHCSLRTVRFFKLDIKYKTSDRYADVLSTTKIKSIRFIRDKIGDYWACCTIDDVSTLDVKINKAESVVGIDLGITHFITDSNGSKIENNKFYIKSQYKLRRLQRSFARKKVTSKNRDKARIKIAKLYRKITRQRDFFFNEVSNKLISDNQAIICETLSIAGMIKNRRLSKSIHDAAWGRFILILDYKCRWRNTTLIKVDKWFPSSKTCSNCNSVKETLALTERVYDCGVCGAKMDRDVNAAINIKKIGLKVSEFKPVENKSIDIQ